MKLNVPLFVNFVDFKKPFDIVHRESLWKILRAYGIPSKIVTIYKGILWTRRMHCHPIERFDRVISRQVWSKGGLYSLSNLVSKRHRLGDTWNLTWNRPRGIQWTLFTYLEDLNSADNLAVISPTRTNLQEHSYRLSNDARSAGLDVNQKKT